MKFIETFVWIISAEVYAILTVALIAIGTKKLCEDSNYRIGLPLLLGGLLLFTLLLCFVFYTT